MSDVLHVLFTKPLQRFVLDNVFVDTAPLQFAANVWNTSFQMVSLLQEMNV